MYRAQPNEARETKISDEALEQGQYWTNPWESELYKWGKQYSENKKKDLENHIDYSSKNCDSISKGDLYRKHVGWSLDSVF